MIRISQIKLPVEHSPEDLRIKAAKKLRVPMEAVLDIRIKKQSLDARKKPELFYSYVIDVTVSDEASVLHKGKSPDIMLSPVKRYQFPSCGSGRLSKPPVIIGTGPAGLFCGLMLARHGYRPLLLERGESVDTRMEQVRHFWQTGDLNIHSNVQFGEGGAGTFSDGKLNTLVKDPLMRNQLVLETFCEFGADPLILFQNKPHIGTDVLSQVVKNMRNEIIRLGGEVRFGCQVTDFVIEGGHMTGVITKQGEMIASEAVILAIGHSARDTFEQLDRRKVPMEQKAFAVGLRIQHPQIMINESQYGNSQAECLGAASYKLTKQTGNGRGVYSFCMCPGGYVVNASSEAGLLAINGMSYHARDGKCANSALIVTVSPTDFPDHTPLGGVSYQRNLEKIAYQCAGGDIPVQLYGDFKTGKISRQLGEIEPQMCGAWAFANLREIVPQELCQSLIEGIEGFGHVIQGFSREDAVLAGIESRTSSPIRIWRTKEFESEISGLYPCGEGAGYAGGITSAAMDGIKVAEAIAARYCPN